MQKKGMTDSDHPFRLYMYLIGSFYFPSVVSHKQFIEIVIFLFAFHFFDLTASLYVGASTSRITPKAIGNSGPSINASFN